MYSLDKLFTQLSIAPVGPSERKTSEYANEHGRGQALHAMESWRLCEGTIGLLGKTSHRQLISIALSQVSTRYRTSFPQLGP